MITEGMTFEIQNLYENTFPKLTEQYFENTPWPDEKEVAPIVDNDHVSNCLYTLIYITIVSIHITRFLKDSKKHILKI